MRYSISSRFRGAILGITIGEWLERSNSQQYSPTGSDASLNRLQKQVPSTLETQNLFEGANDRILSLVISGTRSIIGRGRFDAEDWRVRVLEQNRGLSALQAIGSIVPISLFYHENEIKLRQNLHLALAALGQDEPESQECALAVGYAIALSVQAKLNWFKLISQTIAFVGSQTETGQKLATVKTLLEQNAGLERAINSLGISQQPSSQIALAFYCYLSTLEDFHLAIKRAVRISIPRSQLTSAITGALSGAYNGLASIPATLRMPLSSNSTANSVSVSVTMMTTEVEMLRLSDALVAVWSGVYEQANLPADLSQVVSAIAAPYVMRGR